MTFKLMRSCSLPAGVEPTFPAYISFKLDGIRLAKFEGKSRTKSGKAIPNKFLRDWVENYLPEGLDTEVGIGGPTEPDFYTKTYSGVVRHEGEPDFKLYAFDLCNDLDSYTTERIAKVAELVAAMPEEHRSRVVVVPQILCTSLEQFNEFYALALELGYEGVIRRACNGLYKYGKCTPTSQDQTKHKPDEDYDAEIIGVYEGMTNNNEAFTNDVGETERSTHAENLTPNGRLGGFICRAPEKEHTFKIAPGKLKHHELEALWKAYLANPNFFNGVFLKYRCLDYGLMANNRPRHGRWIAWRSPIDMEAALA